MSKPELSVERLIRSGFERLGCWELNDERQLGHKIDLPKRGGVYAFALDGVVQYLGLASKSVRQRLGFYRKPGASQTTNVRLNEMICGRIEQGDVVEILVAHPPDHDWNGLRVSGPEGLEAGLIRDFDLPWNVRGSHQMARPAVATGKNTQRRTGVAEKIIELVRRRPGMTELEIAKAIYGPTAVQQQVNQFCRSLLKSGRLQRRGAGGSSDPYTYQFKK